MSFPDSMFLFEIVLEELKSFTACKEFSIKSKFADIFTLTLNDPNDIDPIIPTTKRQKRKSKVRYASNQKPPAEGKLQSGQSILFTSPIASLITAMKNYPIELTLCNKDNPEQKIGSVHIPWSPVYIDYLYTISAKGNVDPIRMSGGHNVYDDSTSRRVATILVNTKLTHLRDKLTAFGRSLAAPDNTVLYTATPPKPQSPLTIQSYIQESAQQIIHDPGTIKTVYSGGKQKKKTTGKPKTNKKKSNQHTKVQDDNNAIELIIPMLEESASEYSRGAPKTKSNSLHLVKSATHFNKKLNNNVVRTRSCTFINRKRFNFLNYVFGDSERHLGNRVFYVGYFTVEDFNNETGSSRSSPRNSPSGSSPRGSPPKSIDTLPTSRGSPPTINGNGSCGCPEGFKHETIGGFTFRKCDEDCAGRQGDDASDNIVCLRKADNTAAAISLTKCKQIRCDNKELRKLPPPPPDTIYIDMSSLKKECCESKGHAVEEVLGGMTAKMKYDENEKSCYCECECTFGFVKRTTYCGVCGGFERPGEDMPKKVLTAPFPCPIYHKLTDKNKQKSTSGSDRSKLCDSKGSNKKGSKSPVSPGSQGKPPGDDEKLESDKEYCRKKKRERKDDRFKFNYGYTAPQIGHMRCAMPCTGTLGNVPKNMGWLWTAENIPGMKFRPTWKPGCVHKHVLRLLRMAKDPGIILSKKKKKDTGKKKKPLKRPLLTVAKKDGEYTVTMETMKAYSKPRALNQQPYEDKPVVTYTIGRTEEENRERQKRKEREFRRLQRDQRAFIQSAFTDMCKEICLKTYQQALGFLPDTEDPDCPCYPKLPGPDDTDLNHSCSCSEHSVSFGSDTDSDEWMIEFTPPNAHFDPTYKGKKVSKQDSESQYSYLDYRVKLLDRSGNQVPRFFKGPDGKTQCSDLGGFWSPDHKWLEINTDGYIGPDERWAPMVFIGPHGDHIDCETGKFQDLDGTWLVVGVDGYIDGSGKWKYYPKHQHVLHKKSEIRKRAGDKKEEATYPTSDTTWSCFGDAHSKFLSKLGILGHGHDRRLLLQTLTEMMERGEDVKIPEPSLVPRLPASKKGKRKGPSAHRFDSFYSDRSKCHHPVPTDKGIVAVDSFGNKTYFKLKDYKNKRPHERIAHLTSQGISLSSFHVPCLSSFINAEMMKKQQYERFLKNKPTVMEDMEYGVATTKNASTQYRYRYAI